MFGKIYSFKDASVIGDIPSDLVIHRAAVRSTLINDVVLYQLAKRRASSAHVKNRSEVAGSTRKIYRQKGTGSARHGSKRAPLFRGGGKIFGPRTRDFEFKLNKKVRRLALSSAISMKALQGRLVVFDNLDWTKPKTKEFALHLNFLARSEHLSAHLNKDNRELSNSLVLAISDDFSQEMQNATRNLSKFNILKARGANVFDIVKHDYVFIGIATLRDLNDSVLKKVSIHASDLDEVESAEEVVA